jgi:hypothetical protein
MVRLGLVWHGMAGRAGYGVVRYGLVRYGR